MVDQVTDVLARLTVQFQPWWDVLFIGSFLLGLIIFGLSLISIPSAMPQGGRGAGWGKPMMGLISGTFLLNIGSFLNVLAGSIFASQSVAVLSYSPPGSGVGATYLKFSVYLIMLVGLWGVIQGGYLLRTSTENHEVFWKAILHIVAGTFCVNIILFMQMLGYSAGGGFNTTIRALLG